jgi:2-C-methyl-D-erythritol 4-phosphate cytidylyltransferase/2-C-methyl-D-erythritol 2,4-cyclodiphosphate synthase
MPVACIIVAAGKGERFSGDKLLSCLFDKTVFEHSLSRMHENKNIDEIVVVHNDENAEAVQKISSRYERVKALIPGGDIRAQSVKNGFDSLNLSDDDIVLIHNGSNPLVTSDDIDVVLDALKKNSVASVGHRMVDTVKRVQDDKVVETVDRSSLRRMQTPQGFKYSTLKRLYDKYGVKNITDELQLAEMGGEKVCVVPASPNNFKITTKEDLVRASRVLLSANVLTGVGEDSHKFSKEGELILGGVKISDLPKLEANSDGDVVYHALFNAISSALGLSSMGTVADELCEKGIIDSKKYFDSIIRELKNRELTISSVSVSLECKSPKIDPIAENMKTNIGKLFSIPKERIGITATSGEGLTPFGKGEAIKCICFVALQ